MKFLQLIKSHNWLSIQTTLLNLYPDQEKLIDEYKSVFENLNRMVSVNNEMLIVLTEYVFDTDENNGLKKTCVDVAGRLENTDPNELDTCSYALEFEKWEKWLGMDLAPETLENFNELEIIAHCLYEMTFCGYVQDEIQEKILTINNNIEEYKNLTDEEKKEQTFSHDELKRMFDQKDGS